MITLFLAAVFDDSKLRFDGTQLLLGFLSAHAFFDLLGKHVHEALCFLGSTKWEQK